MTFPKPPLFVARDNDAPREGLPFEKRDAISAVVRNPRTKQYLVLRWADVGWISFITGGIEAGQTPEEAARAEVRQETGYLNLKLVAELPRFDAKFYHGPKGVNRFARVRSFLFDLVDEERAPVAATETAIHTCHWRDMLTLWLTPQLPEGHRFLLDHIRSGT